MQCDLFSGEDLFGILQKTAKTDPSSLEKVIVSKKKFPFVCGVDEAGRGPLAGPVVACACILPPVFPKDLLVDSKTLREKQIVERYAKIVSIPGILYATATVDHEQIDAINILQATFLAMKKAFSSLSQKADLILVDGNKTPFSSVPSIPVISGDRHCKVISAASIIAKYTRDLLMKEYDSVYPEYGFAQHKGYPTQFHREMILLHGPSPIHRKSFTLLGKK